MDIVPKTKALKQAVFIAVPVFLVIMAVQLSGYFNSFENDIFDTQTRLWRKDATLPSDVVLILIDEASLSAMEPLTGRWPWRRDVWADLIEYLTLGGARTIVFDVLFTELSSAHRDGLNPADQRLVQATQNADQVIHACQIVKEDTQIQMVEGDDVIPPVVVSKYTPYFTNSAKILSHPIHTTAYWPFRALCQTVDDIGVASFLPDDDGGYRRAELIFPLQSDIIPSLSLSAVLKQLQDVEIDVREHQLDIHSATMQRQIPLDEQHRYWVNLYGVYEAFSFSGVYASLMQLRQGELSNLKVHPDTFANKVVFIGASAAGVEDLKTTGLEKLTPGVLLHASVYGNIMTNDMLKHAPKPVNLFLLILAIAATALTIFLSRNIWIQLMGVVIVFGGVGTFCLFSFPAGWLVKSVPPVLGVVATYLTAFTWISFSTGKEKRKIKNVLGQYVSPAILTSVLTDHKSAFLDAEVGQRKVLTIQFSDLRGFTSISEKYPVEKVVALLNDYLANMVDVIFDYQGTLDKFIGDAILAFWGAPVEDPEHAYKAVCSALDMQMALDRLNQKNQSADAPQLASGFGIHTGEVILGNIGSQKKLDYTVIGDGVNLASRLESLTKKYHCPIIFTQETFQAVKSRICCRVVDKVQVKGKEQAAQIYHAMGRMDDTDDTIQRIAALTTEGFHLYCQRQFSQSAAVYQKILELNPSDGLSRLFVDRCNRYAQTPPPPSWEGECVLDHK